MSTPQTIREVIEEQEERRRGKKIAEVLGLKYCREHADRYDTMDGTKTDLGLFRTIEAIITGERQ